MLLMFLWCLGEDKYIIQVHDHKLVEEQCEQSVHFCLEGCRRVRKALSEDFEFVQAERRCERSFMHVTLGNLQLEVTTVQVQR